MANEKTTKTEKETAGSCPAAMNCYVSPLHQELMIYFCGQKHCSDSNNNQFPDCEIAYCREREYGIDEIFRIISKHIDKLPDYECQDSDKTFADFGELLKLFGT